MTILVIKNYPEKDGCEEMRVDGSILGSVCRGTDLDRTCGSMPIVGSVTGVFIHIPH